MTVLGALVAAAALTGGCAAGPPVDHLDTAALPDGSPVPPGMTVYRWSAPGQRLLKDIPRAMKRAEWGLLSIERAPAAARQADGADVDDRDTDAGVEENDDARPPGADPAADTAANVVGPIHAQAMTTDNRIATVLAWGLADDEVVVGVRVGHFGDEPLQTQFARTLAAVLAGDPPPQRDAGFRLPPLRLPHIELPPLGRDADDE